MTVTATVTILAFQERAGKGAVRNSILHPSQLSKPGSPQRAEPEMRNCMLVVYFEKILAADKERMKWGE